MKKLFSTIILCSYLFANSQSTFTSTNYASGNYSIPMSSVSTILSIDNFDTTGANVTWDYSNLGSDANTSRYTVTPAASGYQATYIAQCILGGGGFTCLTKWNGLTNVGVVDLDSLDAFVFTLFDVMTMAKNANNRLIGNIKGLKIIDSTGISIPIVAEYSSPDTILKFPFTYQDSGSSFGAWGLDLSSIGQNIQYKVTYDRKWKVEGWGTLITPYQTHNNVLKVKTTLDQVDSVVFFSTPLGLPRKIVEYTWYDANFGLPVMKAEGLEALGLTTINSVLYYDTRVAGINEEKEDADLTIFPNPVTETLNITSKVNNKMSYEIIDIEGKTVVRKSTKQSIEVAHLAAGIYFVKSTNEENNNIQVLKFIKQ